MIKIKVLGLELTEAQYRALQAKALVMGLADWNSLLEPKKRALIASWLAIDFIDDENKDIYKSNHLVDKDIIATR